MSCPFALLGLLRRPLLSDEEIGTAYRRLAGSLHPDQTGGDAAAFRELGEAVAILRDPVRRLRELAGTGSGGGLPPQAAELFTEIASIIQESDTLAARLSSASNPLTKAVLAAPLKPLAAKLGKTLSRTREWLDFLHCELARLDDSWPDADQESLNRLADSFSYALRWESQLRERELVLKSILG